MALSTKRVLLAVWTVKIVLASKETFLACPSPHTIWGQLLNSGQECLMHGLDFVVSLKRSCLEIDKDH